jgi:predicted amidohydrolase YtcJ
MDTTRLAVEAMAVQGDRIAWTGTTEDAQKIFPAPRRIIDLRGATVLPGITDAHTHLIALGQSYLRLNLKDLSTETEIIERVKQKVASTTPNEWIQGWGWDETSNE